MWSAGQLEEALQYYKRSKENGVDRAAMHIRNVCNTYLDPLRYFDHNR